MAHSFIVIDDELYEIELVIKDMMFALIALNGKRNLYGATQISCVTAETAVIWKV